MSGKPAGVYKAEVEVKAPSTANLTLEGPRIPEGMVVQIRQLYVLDLTTAGKIVRLGYDRAGTKYWIDRRDLNSTWYGYGLRGQLIMVGGEKPAGMIESPTSGDTCILVARGIYL